MKEKIVLNAKYESIKFIWFDNLLKIRIIFPKVPTKQTQSKFNKAAVYDKL